MNEEKYTMKCAYKMMVHNNDKKGEEYKKNYRKIQEIAKKYKLPIIYPDRNEMNPTSLTYSLNGFFERFKGTDREKLFTKSYWNVPMFYQKEGVWHLGPEKSLEQFFSEDFCKEESLLNEENSSVDEEKLLLRRRNSSIFKKYDSSKTSNVAYIGELYPDIFGKSKLFDRNKFIEGILAKKRKGNDAVRNFLKKRLLPVNAFYYILKSYLSDYIKYYYPEVGIDIYSQTEILSEKFKETIENFGIHPIKYDGKNYFWYEDYAMIPSISCNPQSPFHLPLEFFFPPTPIKTQIPTPIKTQTPIIYKFNSNDSIVWRYILLKQSSLVRNTRRVCNSQKGSPFWDNFLKTVCPEFKSEKEWNGTQDGIICRYYYYPIFQVEKSGIIKVVDNVKLIPQQIHEGIDYLKLHNIKKDILSKDKMQKQLPEDWKDIFQLIEFWGINKD